MPMPPRIARLVGSKFTSRQPVQGWTHFHVVGVRRVDERWHAELAASCDVGRRVVIPTSALFERDGWEPGWTPLSQP